MRISDETESPVGGLRACVPTRSFRLKHVSFCSGLPGAMARACSGVTRNGRPCSLTSASTLVDDRGRSVASPLRRGGHGCLFHARPFASRPVEHQPESLVVLLLDLETTGVDATQDRIVELSAVQAIPNGHGACFSTVVRVDAVVMSTPTARQAAEVHRISDDEILASPFFPECWRRFLAFVGGLLNNFVLDGAESSDEEPPLPRPPDEPPVLLIAAGSQPILMASRSHRRFAINILIINQ